MKEIDFIEVNELDLRLGLTELLSDNSNLDTETCTLINSVIHETKMRAMKDVLNSYRNNAFKMTQKELIDEKHRSTRLGQFMNTVGYNKLDSKFEAHAIVSGKHFRAIAAREILAQFNIRIDDPTNGIWLPNFNISLKEHDKYSYAHRSIHKKIYYLNITACLEQSMTKEHARGILRRIAQGIKTGSFPINQRMRMREIRDFIS